MRHVFFAKHKDEYEYKNQLRTGMAVQVTEFQEKPYNGIVYSINNDAFIIAKLEIIANNPLIIYKAYNLMDIAMETIKVDILE